MLSFLAEKPLICSRAQASSRNKKGENGHIFRPKQWWISLHLQQHRLLLTLIDRSYLLPRMYMPILLIREKEIFLRIHDAITEYG